MKKIIVVIAWCLLLVSCSPKTSDNPDNLEWEAIEEIDNDVLLYGDNSLETGDLPYKEYYGSNKKCNGYYCSKLTVKTPDNSDVVVILKQDGNVVAHAYIASGSRFSFNLPDGIYQPFFYMGNGWNPNKTMSDDLVGGFVSDESFSKDYPQDLESCELTYELIQQVNGNFQTKPSSAGEMF